MESSAVASAQDNSERIDVKQEDAAVVRKLMRDYWDQWAGRQTESGTSDESMVGERSYSIAMQFYDADRMEMLSLLPANMEAMDVLELGGGSGRYSGELAKRAKTVISTDLIESFVKENEAKHASKYPNLSFRTLDATQLDYPPNSFDLIFSNWLLMYLNDDDSAKYVHNNLKMLRPGGYAFLRESHFRPVGTRPQAINPTIYRSMQEYQSFFANVRYTDENDDVYFFELIKAGNCQTYIYHKGNPTQVYYLWQKTKVTVSPSTALVQQLLDDTLYNEEKMTVYDNVIGNGFVTPGGLEYCKELLGKLNLSTNSIVLDIGCGLGGLTEYLIKEYNIDAIGLELSMTASQAAILRLNNLQTNRGKLYIADVACTNFAANSFDVIIACETVEYVSCKSFLVQKAKHWMKPNGQLLVGMYCLGKEVINSDTNGLLQSNGMALVTTDEFLQLLEEAGYTDVKCEDCSHQYLKYLTDNLSKLDSTEGISESARSHFTDLWCSLIKGLANNDIQWNVFIAGTN